MHLAGLSPRDYDALTGRFTSADSQYPYGALTQGYNAYHYTGNNPTTRTDPSGHDWTATTGQGEAVDGVAGILVTLILTMRDVLRSDLPPVVKGFIVALVVFGLVVLQFLLAIVLLNV